MLSEFAHLPVQVVNDSVHVAQKFGERFPGDIWAVTLPGPIATRALKEVPHIPLGERLPLAARYYAAAAASAARGRVS